MPQYPYKQALPGFLGPLRKLGRNGRVLGATTWTDVSSKQANSKNYEISAGILLRAFVSRIMLGTIGWMRANLRSALFLPACSQGRRISLELGCAGCSRRVGKGARRRCLGTAHPARTTGIRRRPARVLRTPRLAERRPGEPVCGSGTTLRQLIQQKGR